MRTSESSSADNSEGMAIPEIGDLSEMPVSFFDFQTAELNSEIIGVRALMASASSPMAPVGRRGKNRTSTALLP